MNRQMNRGCHRNVGCLSVIRRQRNGGIVRKGTAGRDATWERLWDGHKLFRACGGSLRNERTIGAARDSVFGDPRAMTSHDKFDNGAWMPRHFDVTAVSNGRNASKSRRRDEAGSRHQHDAGCNDCGNSFHATNDIFGHDSSPMNLHRLLTM